MKTRRLFTFCAYPVVLAVILSTPCAAQTAPALSRVTFTHVKLDMLDDWLALQKKEVVPALKKGGVKTRTVYATSIFGNSGEYVTVQPFDKYADFDGDSAQVKALGAAGAAQLLAKLRKCMVSSSSYAITRLADISNVLDGPPAAVIVSARYRITPGKMADFESLVKSDVLPVYKKAKVGLTVSQRGLGTNPTDVTMTTQYHKFADLDGGPFLVKQLGQEGANKLNAKFAGIRNVIEVVIRRRVEDLSF